ncbi:pyridoxamine 5'-phosphate oxidase family protein [Nocardioides sp. WV_118_6]
MALSLAEKQEFLALPHVAALSVAVPGRGPLSVPLWYGYEPGGQPWIITSPASRKMAAIREAGRFTLLVDVTDGPLTYVSVEGPVAGIAPATAAQVENLAGRYLSGPALAGYLAHAGAEHGEQVVVRLEPERWLGTSIAL